MPTLRAVIHFVSRLTSNSTLPTRTVACATERFEYIAVQSLVACIWYALEALTGNRVRMILPSVAEVVAAAKAVSYR